MKRLKDAWSVLRGRKCAADSPPSYNPFASDHSVIGWRYTVNNELLADLTAPYPLARVISEQAAKDVYIRVCELALDRARERRA